jgi:PPOX class probable F420-dependent enzyme
VTVAVDGEGRVVISTREPAMKVRNLRRDPRVSLAAFTDAFYGDWVQVEGTAEIVSLPEAMDLLVDYYRRAAGEHPNWDEYRAAMAEQRRVVIRFAIERAGPRVSG